MESYIQCPIGILCVGMTVHIDRSNTKHVRTLTAQLQSNRTFKIPLCIERDAVHTFWLCYGSSDSAVFSPHVKGEHQQSSRCATPTLVAELRCYSVLYYNIVFLRSTVTA